MLKSMTGFSSLEEKFNGCVSSFELRTVNGRFLDVSVRMPDEWRHLENPVRQLIRSYIKRGHVELQVVMKRSTERCVVQPPSREKLAEVKRCVEAIHQGIPQIAPLSIGCLLHWPGLFERSTEVVSVPLPGDPVLLDAVHRVLQYHQESRVREGTMLAAGLEEKTDKIREITAVLSTMVVQVQEQQKERVYKRLRALKCDIDEEKIRQEILTYSMRADITEEIDRITVHTHEIKRVISSSDPAGKRLDFLLQELNREANTLSAKALSVQLSQMAVELKFLIEQMREQVQNVE